MNLRGPLLRLLDMVTESLLLSQHVSPLGLGPYFLL